MVTNEIEFQPVPAEDVHYVWPHVREALEVGLQRTSGQYFYTIEDVREALAGRTMQLWVVVENRQLVASVITQVHKFPRASAVNIFLMGGSNLDKWMELARPVLSQWGEAQGCEYYSGGGRPAWQRKLKSYEGLVSDYNFVFPIGGRYANEEVYH